MDREFGVDDKGIENIERESAVYVVAIIELNVKVLCPICLRVSFLFNDRTMKSKSGKYTSYTETNFPLLENIFLFSHNS